MSRLDDDLIRAGLVSLPGWVRRGDQIEKSFDRPSFADAVGFVVRVGFLAEAADHHPDIDVRWRTVRLALSTHSEGGITHKDLDLAAAIEAATGKTTGGAGRAEDSR